jgi:Ca-activated chloride channel family protein
MRQRNNRLLPAIAATALACSAVGLHAQGLENTGTVIRTDVRLVVLHTTVVDKSGHLVMNLPQQDFKVYENGVPQEIKKFRREDVPVSMGLIVDNSGSMRDKRARVEAAALALVKDSNPEDEGFVVNFNDEAFLDLPPGEEFTSSIQDMKEALTRIDSRGGTALFDAIRMSIDHVKNKGHRDKKVLVVVTDGNDNSSVISLESLVKMAQQSEVLIYAVGLLGDEERHEANKARRALKELATATGGEAFFPKEVSEVDRIAHQVARDIRSQYIIQYTPSNTAMDGTYRQIKVTVNAPGHLTVRTRTGYYATPDRQAPSSASSNSFKP